MTTAIIGVGNIGGKVARHLVAGGERVVLSARSEADAAAKQAGAHYVKAFGTLSAESLGSAANRKPKRAVLFYATDDARAAAEIERLISAAGFEPVKAGGVKDSSRIEAGGDLNGGLKGKLLDVDEAGIAVAAGAQHEPQLR